ncbi:type II toxin-antitoxin system RelE/ParE family toxin [Lactiplantibacillus garii]|uniref:Type II toxin-antitoxin system RelE/ParE family toxin n=1 Tax=Lactiplantibacillus garii TaxID=2306423 RepID=A0A426D5C7_9LACO|nr:type II toxin-antitoxin system RelE/ParE family toxin [Lactiplantibacillus garii]RRK09855.1 type II toxin-antitoxin system RelE/ParE family toxin [Lactiplantibacillus garii]
MPTRWKVVYANQARLDLHNIDAYIRNVRLAPNSATNLISKILTTIDQLTLMPTRHQLYATEPWHSRGLRYVPVNHYIVFYLPEKTNQTVQILRIMYHGQDTSHHLSSFL